VWPQWIGSRTRMAITKLKENLMEALYFNADLLMKNSWY
jgi:hypothetical protein